MLLRTFKTNEKPYFIRIAWFSFTSFHKEPVRAATVELDIDGLVLGFTSVSAAELWKFCDVIMLILQKHPNSKSYLFSNHGNFSTEIELFKS